MIFRERYPKLSDVFKPGKHSSSVKDPSRSYQNTHCFDCYSKSSLTILLVFDVKFRSLSKHFDELQNRVTKNFSYTIICLSEIWFEDESTHFKIDSYTFFNRFHVSKHQSTCIIVHDSIKAEVFNTEFENILLLKCTTLLKKSFLCPVFIIYHSTPKRN